MPPNDPESECFGALTGYRLSPAARLDLEAIWLYGAQTWSMDQADRYSQTLEETFERLLANPKIARERRDFDPPVRIHPTGSHLIIYRIEEDHLAILRVLGGQQNWAAILHDLDH